MLQLTKQTGIYVAIASLVTGLIIWLDFRPLGLFFIVSLIVLLGGKYGFKIQSSPVINQKLEALCANLVDLRQNKPGFFCGAVSSGLILLAFIGHVISGTCIVVSLLVLAVFISNKYEIKIITDRDEGSCSSYAASADHDDDEFLPEINDANISLLKSVGEEADVSAVYKTDSISDKRDDDEDDDDTYADLLIPQNSITEVDEDQSSESSNDDLLSSEIKFKSGHFNANTSSDSDDSISRGLNFNVVDSRPQKQIQPAPTTEMAQFEQQQQQQLTNLATNLLAGSVLNYIKQTINTAPATLATTSITHPHHHHHHHHHQRHTRDRNSKSYIESSEDDSDFEILNSDELNNS